MRDRILVTGAGGFLGRPLLQTLRKTGHECRALFGPGDALDLAQGDDAVGDIADRATLQKIVPGITTVIHLAGPPGVAQSFATPTNAIHGHALGTAALLEELSDITLRRFVYISSAEVYGQQTIQPVEENAPLRPLSPYAAAKTTAEAIVRAAAVERGHEAIILRPFTLYGPGVRPQSLIVRVIRQTVANEPVEVMDLRPIRDYLWIDDAIEAIVRSISNRSTEQIGVYNLGSGVGHSVRDLISMAQDLAGSNADVTSTGERDRDPALDISELVASTQALSNWLKWKPRTSIQQGIGALVEHRRAARNEK